MRTAIIGYGTMGHEIEKILLERGHTISIIIDADNREMLNDENLRLVDVAIEFTSPLTAFDNVAACLMIGKPVVSGTTGWTDRLEEAQQICRAKNGTLLWSSNFSIGVNVAFLVNKYLAKLMNRFPEYTVSMREVHHTRKKDAPSGTAVTLAEGIIENIDRVSSWVNHETLSEDSLGIVSVREGDVPGIHEIEYESEADIITLCHSAKNRRGFAMGAVLAAEYAVCHKGVLTMSDIMNVD